MLNDKTTVESTVASYIAHNGLLDAHSKYVVALSGGADSVALLLLLRTLGYSIEAAHCNFHLRGKESNRDETFAKDLCLRENIPFHVAHFATAEYASAHKVSIEMAARHLRYDYFEKLRADLGATAICVAHHRNDSVETLIMNLMRGTGIRGLAGIRPLNGNIIRPLLCLSREDIERYLQAIGQDFVTDSTNLVPDVVRNKIRLKLIPLMEEINPQAVDNMQRTAELVAEAQNVFDDGIRKAKSTVVSTDGEVSVIDSVKLLATPSPKCVLFEILKDYGITPQQSKQVYRSIGATPGRLFASESHEVAIDRGRILIAKRSPIPHPIIIPEPGVYIYGEDRRFNVVRQVITPEFIISRTKSTVCVDAAKVAFPLTLRPVRAGDRFVPFGMKGSKLVSDYLTDCKRDVFQKQAQAVLEDARGLIVWLVGERIDNRCRLCDTSREALILSINHGDSIL